jgi:glycosyltransferase involved in cell wall biosynthesis
MGIGWTPGRSGGLNRYVSDLHRAMIAADRDYTTVVHGPALDSVPGVVLAGSEDDPLALRLWRGWQAAQRDADVLSVHFALYGTLPRLVGRQHGRPLVVHFHGPWSGESLATGQQSVAARAKWWIERSLYRHGDRFVALSLSFADLLIREFGVDARSVTVVPPAVDTDSFVPTDNPREARRRLGLPLDGPLVVAVRRLVPRTGVDFLIEAWRQLDGSGATLAIAGSGPQQHALHVRARELGLRHVVWLGEISDNDVIATYQAADVAVVPSRALEGFGLVVLEALACGTPVVGTRVGGLVEVLPGLDPELLVPSEDPAALAVAVRRVIDGGGPSAAECRSVAMGFSWRSTANRLWALYGEALAAT